ncbi:13567_t:CDS:2 [Racocetra persica]|uniref:13567_t:CDS:1 n=1 Tax=Racocetra persica TaxID=160502 RepID=A0ACA9KER9_9GLOM|nr:13567_t:CDS:2 [Racocetra persica]
MLDILVVKNRDLFSLYLQDNDWLVVNIMIQLLEPIFIATEILSILMYPTISDIRLTIIKYWEHINKSTTIGTLLDPQSKTKTFIDMNQRENAITLLHNRIELYKNNTDIQSVHNLQTKKNK